MNYENLENEFLQYASIVKLIEGQEMTFGDTNAMVSTIKNSIDIVKAALNAEGALKNSQLTLALSSMTSELAKLQDELTAKDKEIAQLKEQLASIDKPKLVEQLIPNGLLWFVKGDEYQRPVCTNCKDEENRHVPLQGSKMPMGLMYICPKCQNKTLA